MQYDFNLEISLFDSFIDPIASFNDDGLILYCNHAFASLVGKSEMRVINKMNFSACIKSADTETSFLELHPINSYNFNEYQHIKLLNSQGESLLGQFTYIKLNPNGYLFVFKDLSLEEKLHHKFLLEMSGKDQKIQEMNSLIEVMRNTRYERNPLNIVKQYSKHILNISNLKGCLIVEDKVNFHDISLNDSYRLLLSQFANLIRLNVVQFNKENKNDLIVNNGSISFFYAEIDSKLKTSFEVFIPFVDQNDAKKLELSQFRSITDQISLIFDNLVLENLTIMDDLTKIYNSRYFRDKLSNYTSKFKNLFLVIMDIDFFKKINDTYGHPGGDAVLVDVGARLKAIVDSSQCEAIVARIGGEEFGLLIPSDSLEFAQGLVSNIATNIRNRVVEFNGKEIKHTMSFGIAQWDASSMSIRDLYQAADEALYHSKKNGRDQITVYQKSMPKPNMP